MTTSTLINLYGRYLDWIPVEEMQDVSAVTIEDMMNVCKSEVTIAEALEAERQADYALIEEENK